MSKSSLLKGSDEHTVRAGFGRRTFCTGMLGAGLAAADPSRARPPSASKQSPSSTVRQDGKLRIIAFGAHPDDAEFKAGGVAAMWAAGGHHVKFVAMTNGDLGHYQMSGGPLARRRKAEVQRAAKILGIQTEVLDIPDGALMPTLENRKKVIDLIRNWQAHVVMSHRPYDYHPDHRAVGLLAQDSAFLVTVPFISLNSPVVEPNPVYLYLYDGFQKPTPFQADIVVSIDEVFDQKIDALDALESQVYETVYGVDERTRQQRLSQIPKDPAGRRAWLAKFHGARYEAIANRYRDVLIRRYGAEKGKTVRYAEAFEICEYGRRPTEEEIRKLFPFFPEK
jgi:LmbE family N-acetylglucosaminyl deacetylase